MLHQKIYHVWIYLIRINASMQLPFCNHWLVQFALVEKHLPHVFL